MRLSRANPTSAASAATNAAAASRITPLEIPLKLHFEQGLAESCGPRKIGHQVIPCFPAERERVGRSSHQRTGGSQRDVQQRYRKVGQSPHQLAAGDEQAIGGQDQRKTEDRLFRQDTQYHGSQAENITPAVPSAVEADEQYQGCQIKHQSHRFRKRGNPIDRGEMSAVYGIEQSPRQTREW